MTAEVKTLAKPVAFTETIPSIVHQNPSWPTGFYCFGKAEQPNIDYFNCGLVSRPDGDWLLVRRSVWEDNLHFGKNSIAAFKLEHNVPIKGVRVKIPTTDDNEQFEDPRAVYHQGRVWLSACNFVWYRTHWTGAHQILCQVDDDWKSTRRYDPPYGKNGDGLAKNKGHEKNWVWFFHDHRLHLIYSTTPHLIIEFDEHVNSVGENKTDTPKMEWVYGEIRGGTPPVRIDDEYWTFYHSSMPWMPPKRRYYMGAYAFEAKPPFRITRYTPDPLLIGSQHDKWAHGKPLVVFPNGSQFRDGKWLVVGGCNDLVCFWTEIPHDDLYGRTIPTIEQYKPRGFIESAKRTIANVISTTFKRGEVAPAGEKLELPDVTLICIDDRRPDLAIQAVQECERLCHFGASKFLTSQPNDRRAIKIRPIRSLEDYCRFVVKELDQHVFTSHCLLMQWDGYVVNPSAWRNEWLDYDYIGSPWRENGKVGNGGFSLRSKKLLSALASDDFQGRFMPEDVYICAHNRLHLESKFHIKIAPPHIAKQFAVEDAVFRNQFGFHSFLTTLPENVSRPLVFHHSGDYGDIIYGLAAMKALGGGVLFISPSALPEWKIRQAPSLQTVANLAPLLEQQPYVWKCQYTGARREQVDHDLNDFRKDFMGHPNTKSIFQYHLDACGTDFPEGRAWLTVDFPVMVPGRWIIVNRSQRYHNEKFPWAALCNKYRDKLLFIGTREEHSDFMADFGELPHLHTETLLDVARVIAGAKVFIGNQSAPMAIALGLGVNLIQEVWPGDANCMLKRNNAIYVEGDQVEIPKDWLK